MRNIFVHRAALVLVALLVVGCCFVDASAQHRRTKRSRRITHPVVNRTTEQTSATDTSTTDPTIVSTAADEATESQPGADTTAKPGRTTRPRSNEPAQDRARGNNENLSEEVRRLSDKLSQMEAQQRTLVDLERLTRAEQRAENLRSQLRDVQDKEADLQARLEVLDEAVKPENIERAMAGYGTTRPEELREQRRKQLENERTRVRAQLDQLGTSRTRLEAAITTADAEVDLLRQRVDAVNNSATQTTTTQTQTQTGTDNNAPPTSQTQTPPPTQGTPPR